MLSTVQWFSLCASILYLLIILWNVWRQRLKEAYALLWMVSGVLMIVFSIWTDCLHFLSRLIGIVYPPATLFLLMLAGVILVLFQYSVLLSRNQDKIKTLAQEIARLSRQVEELRKKK